ncbi:MULTISPECIES: cysteine--tRNA ligase [unclassified Gemella]|uniref:cysteine--tRNA ligase n=1 Tax=unclassified Gemella TaxID=2624949 RepID=UPI0015D00B3A|nr:MULTISPECIES: cysteine--tRNA ligase [unclassified Gemella]MBF0710777.1 cysteine--tRNA ligase [Gemella sp. GL1.1]NYS28121.1 cysteine--tRNA ligase [Gemella sp. GL1]
MIKIYNTLSQEKEVFKSLEKNKLSMYVCGPTVYNYIHIGNARPIITFDVVRRYFEYIGYEVNFVSNFTDVDDKIIKAANEEAISTKELSDKYIAEFYKDYDALGCQRASSNPRVSDYIQEIIDFISKLISEDYAYEVKGDVYFRTRKKEDYGKLSKQSIDDLISGARIEASELKEDPLDFALWKAAKDGEVSWLSPWGQGRPGWHIECSVMAKESLGVTIDIHAGGQDLTFPHHENEIAQSECHNQATFANYWMHNGFINIDGTKMSKSLGNFTLVKDILTQVDPMVLRLFMLSVHYRTPINFSAESIELAKTNYAKLVIAYQNLNFRLSNEMPIPSMDNEVAEKVNTNLETLEKEMNDDFNTANVLSAWYELVKISNIYTEKDEVNKETLELIKAAFGVYSKILGISLEVKEEIKGDYARIEGLIAQREDARKNRDFTLADKIRDDLKAEGIILEDTKQGVRWKKE